jgi:hypothetical protein
MFEFDHLNRVGGCTPASPSDQKGPTNALRNRNNAIDARTRASSVTPFHKGVDVRRNGFGVLEQAFGTLEVARHYIPDLPSFQVGGHRRFQVAKLSLPLRDSMAVTARSGESWTRADMLIIAKVG